MQEEKSDPYRAYLLRCWQEGETTSSEKPHWRFSLEGVLHERRRRGFDSLQALLAFLQAELASHSESTDRS
jgi:hypothetical protein